MEPFPGSDADEEHEHVSGVAVEEAYAQWVNLPGGFSLTVGRFRQRLSLQAGNVREPVWSPFSN